MKLKTLRVNKGLSISGLARETGISKALISRIESGERTNFRPETMKKIADALSTKMQEIDEFADVLKAGGALAA